MSIRLKIKQLTSNGQSGGKYIVTDGLGGFQFGDAVASGILSGTTFPTTPSSGDLFYRTDVDQVYHYDDSRSKWLTIGTSTYTCGRESVKKNVTGYMYTGTAVQSSTEGFYMKQNGTIISATIDNKNIMTSTRNIEVRVNNSGTNKVLLALTTGNKSLSVTNANQDFSNGDIIQVVAIANGTDDLDEINVVFEMAWRP